MIELFRPRGVAVVGASPNPLSIGHMVLRNLLEHRYRGEVWPVHPRAEEVLGTRAYASLGEIPGPVDLCNVSVRPELVPEVIAACGERGVRYAIVHTAGYKETGPEGEARERELLEVARRHGVRVFGPNSQGVQNGDPAFSLYANFTFVPMRPGCISILAQSGGMGELLKLHLHRVGVGHRLYASYGNEADLCLADLLRACVEDEGTRVILVQLETLREPGALLEAAHAAARRVPVLALKSGRSKEGARAAASHTGVLADQTALAGALFDRAGVLVLEDSRELIQTAIALATQPLPRGRRLAVCTNTGGPAVQAVDEAAARGLSLARLGEAAQRELRAALLPQAATGNPVDVVATAGPEHFGAALRLLLGEPEVELLLCTFVTAPFVDQPAIAARIAEVAAGAAKPVLVMVETLEAGSPLIAALRGAGLPVYELPEEAPRCLANLCACAELRERRDAPPPPLEADRARATAICQAHRGGWLPQAEAFRLLECYGLRVPRLRSTREPGAILAASGEVGFPCVLKLDSPRFLHKTPAGAVILGIGSREELESALHALEERLAVETPTDAFVLMEQLEGRELALGAVAVPGVGPLLMAGAGGAALEERRQVAFALGPLGREQAARLLDAFALRDLLEGLDRAGLEDALLRLSALCSEQPILELDLNPVLARPGERPVAVDVRVRVAASGAQPRR